MTDDYFSFWFGQSGNSGFRSSFDRGVLQLHFGFKRQFYRK